MTESTSARLAAKAGELKHLLREFLLEHSGLTPVPPPPPGIILVLGSHDWTPLSNAGRDVQARLIREFGRFSELVASLLARSPEDVQAAAAEAAEHVRDVIEQHEGAYYDTLEAALEQAITAICELIEAVATLYDPTPGQPVFVPDANAIIWNPDLELWTFDGAPRFSIVLTSTLLAELDDLKMRHRADSVREKAESAIRRIREYRRRGDIHVGVPLKSDVSTVRMTAIEPDFDAAPTWLDASVKDDRLVAAALEIIREHPHSPVALVTRDINVENKAELAGLPFVQPPDPLVTGDEGRSRRRRGPRPDVRILSLKATGGYEGAISFVAQVQNRGTQQIRAQMKGSIDGQGVECRPEEVDFLVNEHPKTIRLNAARPQLGDLVREFSSETTLYGRSLRFEVHAEDELVASEEWSEKVYDPETDRERFEIQQRVWRSGRGEETEADRRAEALARLTDPSVRPRE